MVFSRPIPLLRYGFKEGDEWTWAGTVRLDGKRSYTATAMSRVTSVEVLKTQIGQIRACHIDTVIAVRFDKKTLRFPSVRWLAPGVGFVRLSFAVKGEPATSDITRVHLD